MAKISTNKKTETTETIFDGSESNLTLAFLGHIMLRYFIGF